MSNPGAASTQTSTYVGGGEDVRLGNDTGSLIGFYGAAGAAQATAITSVATTASSSTTNAFGYTTSTQADAIVTAVNSILVALRNVNLIAT